MGHASLYRSTPFRLAMTFGLLFVVAFLVSGLVTYQLLKRQLSGALDTSVSEIYSVTASAYAPDDIEDLITTITAYSDLKSSEKRVFSLVDPKGKRIAGNFTASPLPDGFSTVEGLDVGSDDDSKFRLYAGTVGGNRLIVGQSFAETDDLENIAFFSFSWALVMIVLIAIAGSTFLATRAQRRLDGIVRTMFDVSNGQMDARIPLRASKDDIDTVSRQINQALDRLSATVDGMRQVSADIAHELKTPLNRLKMTIEEAVAKGDEENPLHTYLVEALAESDRINATFEALLRISQIEAGARKARFRNLDLLDVMKAVEEIYSGVAEDSGQSLNLETNLVEACVTGDQELLTQLLVNLVENAINHCPTGTRIILSLSATSIHLVAEVRDNGPGIPPRERDLVFQRLYRLDKSRTTPGSGLGLTLVRAISDLHSGQIVVTDNHPGLRISVHLPKSRSTKR
ncbi:sensor histidine kinase [Rhizobium tubonense]|uniref:histidine kinase n=1 Tax=Rhizobium tubonense TaxID=484088 RepID=A0A2W4CXW2_9HYPH|nr:HAMP domain-containing sensor histidine kinase [Rhizobium tubonense]PZM15045.1 two-component sensor histidine kinase [Rhizobium tubonense]